MGVAPRGATELSGQRSNCGTAGKQASIIHLFFSLVVESGKCGLCVCNSMKVLVYGVRFVS